VLGKIYYNSGNVDKAIESAKKAIEHNPKNADAYSVLGNSFSDRENYALAIEHMEKAANLDNKYFSWLGDIYHNSGNVDKAIESANKAIEHNPKNAQAYYVLGESYSDRKNYALAIEYMEKAANLDPEYFADLGKVHEKQEISIKQMNLLGKQLSIIQTMHRHMMYWDIAYRMQKSMLLQLNI